MPKLIKSIDSKGKEIQYDSIAQAATSLGCNESTIRKAVDKSHRSAVGRQWVSVDEDTLTPLDRAATHAGVSKETIRAGWAKITPKGEVQYSFNFKKDENVNIDTILSNIEKVIKRNVVSFPITPPEENNENILMVYTSDKHIGAHTKENSLFINRHDENMMDFKMSKVFLDVLKKRKLFGRFKEVVVVDLGDPLDGYNGYTTRGGHKLPQNMSNEQAFDTFFNVHRNFFDQLVTCDVASSIRYYAVSNDNHSGSMGYMAQRALQIYLNTKYPYIITDISDKFLSHFTIDSHTFILTHGKDSEDRAKGLPLVLDDKTKNFISSYIDHYQLNSTAGYVHLIKGDLHQSSSQLIKKFRYRNVLSMYGASSWIQNNFGGETVAGVSMDIISTTNNVVFETNLIF